MRSLMKLGLVVLTVVALAAPTTAQEQTSCRDDLGAVVVPEAQQSWIHDTGGVKAGNLAAAGGAAFPTWDDTAPGTSVTGGAGGGYLASSIGITGAANDLGTDPWDEQYTATFKGTFDGCLDTMGITLHMFAQADPAVLGFHMMAARVLVGDTVLVESEAAEVATQVNPNGSGDITYVLPFAFRDLVAAFEGAGLDPAGSHELTLQVQPVFEDAGHVVYLWDTTEVPSGIVFNAPNLATYTRLN